MLKWAVVFFIISLIAAAFGFTDIAAASAGMAKVLFTVFFVLFLVFLIAAVFVGKKISGSGPGAR
jgi:uncharacterized membrane protein YtjA (UPF0391 family)